VPLRTYAIAAGREKFGVLVSPDCRYMAILYWEDHKLLIYRIEDGQDITLLHTLGRGTGPKQFQNPFKMCWAPCGNLLVSDEHNNRVQELTGLGEAEPSFVRAIPVSRAFAIAIHGDVLAVSTRSSASIHLLSYRTGAETLKFGSAGTGPGQIGPYCNGLSFTPDGLHIVAADHNNPRLSLFRASDGCFVKHIGVGIVSSSWKDVVFAPTGELLVAECNSNCINVFDAGGDTLLRSWGSAGSADGQFQRPTALTFVGAKLYALDYGSARVQLFE
jgi:DNA-binding beta-propeller fold protein YncE